jgi:hypothetical protein
MDTKSDENTGAVGQQARPALLWQRRSPSLTSTVEVTRRLAGQRQIPHPSIRQLIEYWNERRGRRLAPERADIEPNDIRGVLADSFLLSFDPSRGHRFRFAGTRICALFRRELKGEGFLDLWSAMNRNDMRALLAAVADRSVGVIATAAAMGAADERLTLYLLLLPLSNPAQTNACLLGALIPSEPPLWLGSHTLSDPMVENHHYITPSALVTI